MTPGFLVKALEPVYLCRDSGTSVEEHDDNLEVYMILPGEIAIVVGYTRFTGPSDTGEESGIWELLTNGGFKVFNVFKRGYVEHAFEVVSE